MTLINSSQTLVDIHTYGVSSQRRRIKHEACFRRLFPALIAEIRIPQSGKLRCFLWRASPTLYTQKYKNNIRRRSDRFKCRGVFSEDQ